MAILFTANITGMHAEVDIRSAQVYNWDSVVTDYGATYNGSGQTPPAALYEGVASGAFDGSDSIKITYTDQEQYECGWHKTQNFAARGYGDDTYIKLTLRLDANWLSNAGNQFRVKLIDILDDTSSGYRFVSQMYPREVWNEPVLDQNSGANYTATYYGMASDEFGANDWHSLGMRREDGTSDYATPIPLANNRTYHLQMRITNQSAASAVDGRFRWYLDNNDITATSDPLRYGESALIDYFLSNVSAIELGSYIVGNGSGQNNILHIDRFEIADTFDSTWCPWDVGHASRLPFVEDYSTGDFSKWDGSNVDTGMSIVTTDSVTGRRCCQHTITDGSGNNNYQEYYIGDHPLNTSGNDTAIDEVWLTLHNKISVGYTNFPQNDQKLALINFCDPTTGTRQYQMMLAIQDGGLLIVDRAHFNGGVWAGATRYQTTHSPVPGNWEYIKVRIRNNDSGVQNGELDVEVDGVNVLTQTGIYWTGDQSGGYVHPNKLIATSYTTTAGGGQNATIWQDWIMLTAADPGEAPASDTTAPTFTAGPTAANQTVSGHDIQATLDEDGTIYAVRLADGATAPSSAQVKAGQDSTGSPGPEADSVAATASVQASMTFSGGSESTAYDYYVVAEDDEATPNLQASPTLVNATTGAAPNMQPVINDQTFNVTLSPGADLLSNGAFTTDLSNWTQNVTHWVWSAGRAYHPMETLFRRLTQQITVDHDYVYQYDFDAVVTQGDAITHERDVSNSVLSTLTTILTTGAYQLNVIFDPAVDNISYSRRNATAGFEGSVDNSRIRPICTKVVGTVQASDPDEDPLTFAIIAGNTDNDLAIDTNTGELSWANAPDPSRTASYALTIEVDDGTETASATITINVAEGSAGANRKLTLGIGIGGY
ncbi:MAG: hypothetical protein DBP02_02145 [gamma proteobacterium symbiont of Ctena orbiculata]|nr:MAG: hypothetical protein DBP02_02145 [gamma proteobacterium symbiont of Ctena orbiculata]